MSANKPMIFTKDKETADQLIKEGFVMIKHDNSGWTFLNSVNGKSLSELSFEKKDAILTDRLCV